MRVARVLVLAAVAVLASVSSQAESVYYRYRGADGGIVIEKYISPEAVHRGYQVVNAATGEVVKTVPGDLTPRERADQAEQLSRERRAQVQRKYDQSLLLRYSSVDEIAEARDRALHQIDMRIDILHNNLNSVKQQIEAQQAKAADFERDGRTVPTTLARYIEDLKQEIVHAESRIRQRRKDRVDTADAYARDIDRFRQLTKNSDRQARQPD